MSQLTTSHSVRRCFDTARLHTSAIMMRSASRFLLTAHRPQSTATHGTEHLDGTRQRSRNSKRSFQNPLVSAPNPSLRNVVVPDAAHAKAGSRDTLPAELLRKRAERALALQMQKDVLWAGATVDSTAHRVAQHFLNLRTNVKYRSARQLFIVGGKEFIRELCAQGFTPKHLLIPSGAQVPDWADGRRTEIVVTDRKVTDEVVPGTDGFVGDFSMPPPPSIEHLIANKHRLERVLVLDNVEDPGTLGSLLRSATSFMYDAVLLVNHCADLYDLKVIRAARGAHFQQAVPFYQLREEDGDDTYGMLRHVVKRNELLPVCFTPRTGVSPQVNDTDTDLSREKSAVSPTIKSTAKKLSQFLVDEFAKPPSSTKARNAVKDAPAGRSPNAAAESQPSQDLPPAYMIIAGPDHIKGSLERRLAAHIPQPVTTLLVDSLEEDVSGVGQVDDGLEPVADLLTSMSCLLYALRPSGDWDYLPEGAKSYPSHVSLQNRSRVQIGPDRLLPITEDSLNLTREEQVAAGNYHNQKRKEKRLRMQQLTDYGHWMSAETERIRAIARRERQQQQAPWLGEVPLSKREKAAQKLPDHIPSIINDYKQPLDREVLREEMERASTYSRPSNYDHKMRVPKTGRR